jgi:hypothetical protein
MKGVLTVNNLIARWRSANSVQGQLRHLSHIENISSNFSPTCLKNCTFNVATALARETLCAIAKRYRLELKIIY